MVKTKKFNGVPYRKTEFIYRKKSDATEVARVLRAWKWITPTKKDSTPARVVKMMERGEPMYVVYTGKRQVRTSRSRKQPE